MEGGNGQEKNKLSSLARFCWPSQEFPTIGSVVGNAVNLSWGSHPRRDEMIITASQTMEVFVRGP